MSHVEYDPIEAPTAAGWEREATLADDRNDAERQREVDNRLTLAERRIAIGCLSTFVLQMGRDLRKGELTPEGEARYRSDMKIAGEAMAKLMAVQS